MKKLLDRLQQLIEEAKSLQEQATSRLRDGLNVLFPSPKPSARPKPEPSARMDALRQLTRWLTNCQATLKWASLSDHQAELEQVIKSASPLALQDLSKIAGLLESAYDTVRDGFVGDIRQSLQVEVFSSIIDEAETLFSANHPLPAAVLARVTLESWLRGQARKAGLQTWQTDKASSLNDQLKAASVFSVPKWRQIQSFLDVGNAAAHGNVSAFSTQDVNRMLAFVRATCE